MNRIANIALGIFFFAYGFCSISHSGVYGAEMFGLPFPKLTNLEIDAIYYFASLFFAQHYIKMGVIRFIAAFIRVENGP